MQIAVANVLSADELTLVRKALKGARFVDGRATAGFAAKLVKNNRHAASSNKSLDSIRNLVGAHPRARGVCARRAAEGTDAADVLAL